MFFAYEDGYKADADQLYITENYLQFYDLITKNKKQESLKYEFSLPSIPRNIKDLLHLKTLDLSDTNLTFLSPEIRALTNLTELLLYENRLKKLPEKLLDLEKLEKLILRDNDLETLPKNINKLNDRILKLESENQELKSEIQKEFGGTTND